MIETRKFNRFALALINEVENQFSSGQIREYLVVLVIIYLFRPRNPAFGRSKIILTHYFRLGMD